MWLNIQLCKGSRRNATVPTMLYLLKWTATLSALTKGPIAI